MNSDELLIIQYQIPVKPQKANDLRDQILKQKETGVILLPHYCTVIAKPKDIDIQVEKENKACDDYAVEKDHGGDGYQYVMR